MSDSLLFNLIGGIVLLGAVLLIIMSKKLK